MLTSSRRGISYPNPDRSDRPDVPAHILNLINALELDVVYAQGTDAARLSAAHQANGGKIWWTTDTHAIWYDDGAAWWQIGAGMVVNTYANRPAANAVPPGTRYLASDTLGHWYSDGSTWTLTAQGTPRISLAAFALAPWTTPYDMMKVALTVDATNGIYWVFQYNSGSASAFKWEFQGGPLLYSEITTSESTASATYTPLTTAGPSIAIPRAGDYDVSIGVSISLNQGLEGKMSYDIGGTAALDADYIGGASPGAGGNGMYLSGLSRTRRKTGLTAVTLTAKYKAGNGTPTFSNRWMSVIPVRIS